MRMFVAICLATAFSSLGLRSAGAQGVSQKVSAPPAQEPMPQYWFGVAVENIPPTIARQLKLRSDQGVMVVAVLPGSPAEKAGLKADDLLIELNGKPLTSQEELARAANTVGDVQVDTSKGSTLAQASEVVFLREGNRETARIKPELRPASMAVTGSNTKVFTLNGGAGSNGIEVRNYTLPNGSTVYVGPGYQVDSKSQGSNMRVLRDAVGKGDTLVLTQETDEAGNVRNTISDGKTSYVVEAGKVDKLPANLRPLAQQMLSAQIAPGMKAAAPQVTLEERLDRMEKQNQDLQQKLDSLQRMLIENAGMKAVPETPK